MIILRSAATLASLMFGCAVANGAEAPGFGHSHDPSPGAWISNNFSGCCGEGDCFRVSERDLRENLDGSWTYIPTGEVIPLADIKPTLDGDPWRCINKSALPTDNTRCLFVLPKGF